VLSGVACARIRHKAKVAGYRLLGALLAPSDTSTARPSADRIYEAKQDAVQSVQMAALLPWNQKTGVAVQTFTGASLEGDNHAIPCKPLPRCCYFAGVA
jgi:hypothetical protein